MKKLYTLLLSMTAFFSANAQISITDANLPQPGDTARRSVAIDILGIDYHLTGTNYLWDYDTLRVQSQLIDSFLPLIQTNPTYAFYFANTPFNSNKSTFGTHGNGILGFTNPYNFFFLSPTVYKATGVGLTLNGIQVPTGFTKHDTIYNLPLNYGDVDSANSQYSIYIPVIANFLGVDYSTNRKRVNRVDGWGTLNTPHGSYNTVRVMSHITGVDTIYIGPFPITFPVNNFEYKWLTDSAEIVPVLQINTSIAAGGSTETIDAIWFKDDFIKVYTANVPNQYCAGASYSLDYIAEGTFNSTPLGNGNVFRAQLSDATGSFAAPVVVGTDTSVHSGTMTITIPANTPAGANYRIRIVSTNLPRTGANNGFDIAIAPGPVSTVTATGNTTFCDGDSVALTGIFDATYSYQWQLNGLDIAGATSDVYVAYQSGVYTLVTTNACTSIPSNDITVTINPAPLATFTSQFTGICAGDSTLLSVNNVLPGDAYQWLWNGIDIPNATNATYFASLLGDYNLVVTNICGADTSAPTTLIVNSPPVATINASGATNFCNGDSVLMNATIDSSYIYQWQLDGTDINGATADSYYALLAGTYTAVTTNACGQVVSNGISVTVATNPVATISAPVTDFCTGDSAMLSAAVLDPGFTYQWQLNGVDISGATASDFYAATSGNYSLVVSTAICGTATSTAVTINAIDQPTATITATGATDFCFGDSLLLSATTDPGYYYQWQFNGFDINGATAADYYALLDGDYDVIISNYCGAALSNSIHITVNPLPVAAINATAGSICNGDSSYLSSANLDPTYSYQWQLNNVDINGATSSDFYASVAGDYTLVINTPSCGSQTSPIFNLNVIAQVVASFNATSTSFCNGDSTLLYAPYNTGYAYQWQFNGVDIIGATDSLFYASVAGDYSLVAATTLCGTDTSASITLTMLQPPVSTVIASGNVNFCFGDSVTIIALIDPGYTYQWQFNTVDIAGATSNSYTANQTGVYNVVITNTCGTVTSTDVTVTVFALPDANFTASSLTACIGDSILLSATNDPFFTYQWQLDSVDIAGATTPNFYALSSGNYSLIVSTSFCGTDTSAATTLIVDPIPVANVTVVGQTFFCNGDSVTFNATPGATYNYQWQFNATDIIGATASDYVAYNAGVYNLLITNGCTTVSSQFISVSVIPTPDTTMTIGGPTSFCAGDSVLLSVPYDASFTYVWSLNGNGLPSDTLNFIYANSAGVYVVEVNSILGCGKEISSPVTITIGAVPPFTLQSTAAVCQGDTVILDATVLPPTLNFQWWMDGNIIPGATSQTLVVTDSGSYALQYWSPCDTAISNAVNVIINQLPAVPAITQVADTLTCTTVGAAYQWYLNGTVIAGATSQTFTVLVDGDYTVIVTDANGCTNTSTIFTFNSSGITVNDNGFSFNIAPNPTVDNVMITFGTAISQKVTVNIISTSGSNVQLIETSNSAKGTKNLRIDLSSFAAGIYMLEIKIGNNVYHQKIVKQ